ncbi:MAG: class I SAM-dependent methyltransferase [Promethearchaeota archaeon]
MDHDKEFMNYYNKGLEDSRLDLDSNRLEKIRTLDILERYLPSPPAIVLDIGGGTGVYSFTLSDLGYEVHLIDIVPLHINQTREKNSLVKHKLKSITLGDACKLHFSEHFADVVLFFGPLYHLVAKEDRERALKEAYRVLKPGGILFSVGISRYASLIDGFHTGNILDDKFARIVKQDLIDGQHRNPTNIAHYFTTSYFHHPNELYQEHVDTGFQSVEILSIESPLELLGNIGEYLNDSEKLKLLLTFLRDIEKETSLVGASPHIMVIARRD